MSFSDEDVMRLKCTISDIEDLWGRNISKSPLKLKAIFTRLEAAENLNGYANHTSHCEVVQEEPMGNCSCGFDRGYDKWRKSAGRDTPKEGR